MNTDFSIYNSPFSDETKKIRRNSLLASGLSLFIGLSGNLPEKFALLGVTFTTTQQNIFGWFIFSTSLYLFLHFISVGSVEIAKWLHPYYVRSLTKKEVLKHGAFDETDFINLPGPDNEQDKSKIYAQAEEESEWYTKKRLKYLYNLVYLKLIIEVLVPFAIGAWGLYSLFQLITNRSS